MMNTKWPPLPDALIYLILLTFIFGSSNGLPCSYQNPRVEDILFEVPIGSTGSSRKIRSANEDTPSKFGPLRIHIHYDDSVLRLPPDKQIYVNSSLLPEAAGFWENTLNVRKLEGAIKLRRKCLTQHYYFKPDKKTIACEVGCKEKTTCGEALIPNEHLLECQFCSKPDACATLGVSGDGVENADFVLYVSAIHTKRCDNADTLSYAAHCQQETDYDRPIAGHVNLCPSALSTHKHDKELLISTVKHEMVHALGFSAGLFAFFRDETGQPRTKRNRYGKPLTLNRESGYYNWDESTIRTVLRENWWTAQGNIIHPVHIMVTPKVQEEARKHFGCDSLEGAELENQGGEGTALTHWEKRLFENEAMTGTHTQNPVYSRITLALLEDSGWYKPNYNIAEQLHWGHNLGCDFATKSCGEWIKKQKNEASGAYPFCEHVKHDGKKSLAVTRCTAQRDSLALCNLIPYKTELPIAFRNFDSLPGVQAEGVKHFGGSVELADFCPYNQEFEWKSLNGSTRRDSRCELEENQAGVEGTLEIYGASSRCFDLYHPWTEKRCGRTRSFTQYHAGCYEHACINGTLFVGVDNSTQLYPCYKERQKVHIKRIINGWLREGVLICPPCEQLCTECRPAYHSIGEVFDGSMDQSGAKNHNIPEFIGDPDLPEPCASIPLHPFLPFLFSIVALFFI